ncbi:hypothetical protein [Cellulomonas sp. PhB150]|uniref:hypothetical protein n=1 Tax=Cellulomonas sp. PhB150 TaxID=2485188 RepID=UPI000F9C8C66|nr:hypothetical protein [Cellulomonas sp. PhB150]ROS23788.1 hypothetical protein EDF34_2849 [Cellulomonas sp. PhB150]
MPRRPGARAHIEPAFLPEVWLARDRPPDVVRELVRSGRWARVARGIYLAAKGPDGELPIERARRHALGVIVGSHRRLNCDHWFSHTSAALVWGLPTWRLPSSAHVLCRERAGSQRASWLTSHHGEVVDSEVTEVSGLPVTTLARTVADCLMTLPPLDALVVADAALHRGLTLESLESTLRARRGRAGSTRARAVLDVADDGAESSGESASRFVLLRDGLPAPTTQIPVSTRLGTYWVDLGWEEWGLLLEYDGRVKYASRADLMQEKRRGDALVEAGGTVLRVTHEDLATLSRRVLPHLPRSVQRSVQPRRALAA